MVSCSVVDKFLTFLFASLLNELDVDSGAFNQSVSYWSWIQSIV